MSSPLPVMPFHPTLTPHNPHSALLLGLNIFKGIKVQKTACLISNSPWDCRFDLRALKRWRELRRESEQGGREMDKDIRCWKKQDMKPMHILQAAVGSNMKYETRTYTELEMHLT